MAAAKKPGARRPTIGSSHGSAGGRAKKSATGAGAGATGKNKPRPKKGSSGPIKPKDPRAKKAARPAVPKRAAGVTRPRAASIRPPRAAAAPEDRPVRAEAKTLALAIANAALDKKALDVQIVDVVGTVDYADYLVLMSGRSDRHVLAVADGIQDALVKATPKRKPVAVEGRGQGIWVVLDFNDVVAHVFQEEARSFYDLDSLWNDARRIPVAAGPAES